MTVRDPKLGTEKGCVHVKFRDTLENVKKKFFSSNFLQKWSLLPQEEVNLLPPDVFIGLDDFLRLFRRLDKSSE
jgi:hypothetical protein